MSDAPLILRDDASRTVQWTHEAITLKTAALESSAIIGRVSNADENATAVAAQQEIARCLKLCEATRKACKEPIIEFGKRIDDAAKAYRAELEEEQMRLAKLTGDFQALELAKQRAAERVRRLEEEKIQREREAEERLVREKAEAMQRQLREEELKAQQAAATARNERERQEAEARQLEIDRQRALAEAQSHKELEAVHERSNAAAAMLPAVVEAEKADGQSVEEVWIIDSIREFELMKARPNLVRKVEFDMIALKAELKSGAKIPGVTAHKEVKARVRAGRAPLTLSV